MNNNLKLEKKLENLRNLINGYGSLAIAFSGGVDSTFLAMFAYNVLGDNLLLVTAKSSTYPELELEFATKFAKRKGIRHVIVESEECNIPGFSENPPERCYYCKNELFTIARRIANVNNISYLADGTNADDLHDYRPGLEAAQKQGVVHPLKDASLTKQDIRDASKAMGLETWDKPAFACLASRFPYGEKITDTKLKRVGTAEEWLRGSGFKLFRVRSHDNLARVEFSPKEINRGFAMRSEIAEALKSSGFTFVSIDCEGYRTGSMNEMLQDSARSFASTQASG